MASRRGHRGRGGRPRRGEPGSNVLVEGDTGIPGGPQGGASPGATESGDLAAREFGVPQADLPGGVKHLVNPQTKAAETVGAPPRPADYHKEHGVEPADWGDYVTPPDASEETADRPQAEPAAADDAVPVFLVQRKGDAKRIRALVADGPVSFASGTTDPVRLANRDPARIKFWITNEATPNPAGSTNPGVRIGEWETIADGRGLLIPAGQIKDFVGQDAIYLTNQSGTAVTISWGYETEVAAARPEG